MTETPKRKRKNGGDFYSDGYRAGLKAAMFRAALIADSHRAMHLDDGRMKEGIAVSSVAAFIIQAAREWGVWNDNLKLPLVKSKNERAEE